MNPSGFYVDPRNSQLNLDDRLNPSDYAANSKKVQKQKKHLFLRSAFL